LARSTRQRNETAPTPKTTDRSRIDFWPDDLGPAPWRQIGTECTAYAIGAAAYWNKVIHGRARGLGAPDFEFLYNNEAFLESGVVKYFEAWAIGEMPELPVAFEIEVAARVAAVFGVRFLPRDDDGKRVKLEFTPPPQFDHFVEAGDNLYVFRHVFQPQIFDPNAPVDPRPRSTGPRHQEVRKTLAAGKPVVVGFCNYRGHSFSKNGDLPPLKADRGEPTSSHAVLLVGYDDATQHFRFRNSQGPEWGVRGYGRIPYDWIDDDEATFGFVTLSPPDGSIRRRVLFDRLTVKNRRASKVRVSVKGYDGRRTYLGGYEIKVDPSTSEVLRPVRWTETYRLVIKAGPVGEALPSRAVEINVNDPDGAVASAAEIVVPRSERLLPTARFFRADGKTPLESESRETKPAGP